MAGFSILPLIGIDTNQVFPGSVLAASGYVQNSTVIPPFRVGEQTIGTDGRLYVFCSIAAGQNLPSAATTVTVTPVTSGSGPYATTTCAATTGGGSYIAPTFTQPASLGTTGNTYPDFAWFAAAGKLVA